MSSQPARLDRVSPYQETRRQLLPLPEGEGCGEGHREMDKILTARQTSLHRCARHRVTPGIGLPPCSMITVLFSIVSLVMSYSVAYWSV